MDFNLSISALFLIWLLLCWLPIIDCLHYKERLWKRGKRSTMGNCSENSAWPSTTWNLKPFQWKDQLQGAFRDCRAGQAQGWGCKVSELISAATLPCKCTKVMLENACCCPFSSGKFSCKNVWWNVASFLLLHDWFYLCICRLRELTTLKGHVESVVKLKGLDIDTIQQHYTV